MASSTLTDPTADPLLARFRQLRDQQARANETLDAARAQLANVQYRMNCSWAIGGLTTAQKEELTGLADMIVRAQEAQAVVDRELQALIPPAPGQRGAESDPVLIKVSAPNGASLRGRHWPASSVVVADNLTATALLGAGIVSTAE